jgi:hypothetical protein
MAKAVDQRSPWRLPLSMAAGGLAVALGIAAGVGFVASRMMAR